MVSGKILNAFSRFSAGQGCRAAVLVAAGWLSSAALFGQSGGRVALVIGNGAYEHVPGLMNPINDAQDVGATLENLGFAVTRVLDANKGTIRQAVDEFQARAARKGTEVALFYYAGHGVEHEGINYIIPVNARIANEYQLLDQGVSLERVTLGLERSRAAFNMVVLDACRDNPFFKSRSSGGRGLAAMSGGGRSMIVFATSPGEVAADGRERNSPFTKAFIQHAATPGLEVSAMMRQVNGTVQELTGGKQVPWFNVSYTGEVYLGDAEALSNLSARAGAVGRELSALEADIARIQKQLAAADSEAEKKRLKAEERRARAAEAAKRLQAEQLSEIETKARQALEQSRADEALRSQMETQLAAQRVNLSQQAEKRRKELEELRRRDGESQGVWDQFETIAGLSKAIADINGRFDAMAVSLEEKMNAIIAEREAAIEKDNPKQPFETQKEYETHIAGLKTEARTEWQADLKAKKAEQNKARREELADLRKELGQRRRELNGSQFTLDMNAVEVEMARFDAETKVFPLKVQSTDKRFTFAVPVSLKLKSRERKALGEEYFRIYSADQSGGLAGEITYTVEQVYPDIWTLQPTGVRVVNLLDNDREMARSSQIEGGMVVTTAGRAEPLAAVVRLESEREKAQVWVGGRLIGATPLVYPLPAGSASGALRAEFRWPGGDKRVFSIALRSGLNASAIASPQGLERRWGRADTARLGLVVEGLSPDDRSRTEDTTPTLSWKTSSGAGGYQVQVADSRGGLENVSPVGVASRRGIRGTYTPVEPLKGGQNHYWRVRAVDGNGHFGVWSVAASIYIRRPEVPDGYVLVEGGTFRMGSTDGVSDEKPVHSVTVGSFYMKATEVTHQEFLAFLNSAGVSRTGELNGNEIIDMDDEDVAIAYSGGQFKFTGSSYAASLNTPVIEQTWYGAVEYCNWLSKEEGRTPVYRINGNSVTANWSADGYRLPTEAEWEYAARGGKNSRGYKYSGSNSVGSVGWYDDNSGGKTQPVGQKQANELGLYDMSGNVWEWCWDWYGDYSSGSQSDPRGPSGGSSRVNRGGSWLDYGGNLRSANRGSYSPGGGYSDLGFRPVRRT